MKKLTLILIIITLAYSCKKAFAPVAVSSKNSYLVIEGVINSGADSTYFRLSRTIKLSAKDTVTAELNAAVTVEGDNNTSYPIYEIGSGNYAAPPLGLTAAAKYRLRIKTSNNEEYLSDFVEAKTTPPIDSVTYKTENEGVEFYVTTHDPSNSTRYYRWDFDETWGYITAQRSFYKIGSDGLPEYRTDPQDLIYECFKTGQSHQVLLGNSSRLAQDLINGLPVNFITAASGKISHGYSVLFRQYALTAEGYNYWQQLKKNTEDIGTIFDTQPSVLPSNIHCISNPSQPVIGFISASTITTQRIFADEQHTVVVVPTYLPPPTESDCAKFFSGIIRIEPEDSFKTRLQQLTFTKDTLLTIAYIFNGKLTGYGYVAKQCADCRVKAPFGTNLIPVFWPANYHF
ncbi:MAG: DUF4249 domain-containing protein [Mucilaginibacter sp.]